MSVRQEWVLTSILLFFLFKPCKRPLLRVRSLCVEPEYCDVLTAPGVNMVQDLGYVTRLTYDSTNILLHGGM